MLLILLPPGGNRRDKGSFGRTQLPRRGQVWSKATEQPLSSVRVSQPGSQEAGLLIRAGDHRHDNWTAYSFPQQQQGRQGCRFAFGWGAMRAVRGGDSRHPVWGKEVSFLRVA